MWAETLLPAGVQAIVYLVAMRRSTKRSEPRELLLRGVSPVKGVNGGEVQ